MKQLLLFGMGLVLCSFAGKKAGRPFATLSAQSRVCHKGKPLVVLMELTNAGDGPMACVLHDTQIVRPPGGYWDLEVIYKGTQRRMEIPGFVHAGIATRGDYSVIAPGKSRQMVFVIDFAELDGNDAALMVHAGNYTNTLYGDYQVRATYRDVFHRHRHSVDNIGSQTIDITYRE